MVRIVAEVFTIDVLFQVAVAVERPQAFLCWQASGGCCAQGSKPIVSPQLQPPFTLCVRFGHHSSNIEIPEVPRTALDLGLDLRRVASCGRISPLVNVPPSRASSGPATASARGGPHCTLATPRIRPLLCWTCPLWTRPSPVLRPAPERLPRPCTCRRRGRGCWHEQRRRRDKHGHARTCRRDGLPCRRWPT